MGAGAADAPLAPRIATINDAETIARLHAKCFKPAWDEEVMEVFLRSPECLCFLSGEQEELAGFVLVRIAADEAEILTIAVDANSRRKGIGNALLGAAIAALKERGAKNLFLEVDEGNAPALALYRGLGAKPVGRRAAYYDDGGDAAILRLALQSSLADNDPSR